MLIVFTGDQYKSMGKNGITGEQEQAALDVDAGFVLVGGWREGVDHTTGAFGKQRKKICMTE